MNDDIAPSADGREPPSAYAFAQGTVVAWDASAGTNTVRVRGRECTNLPSLIGSETGLIQAGDSVCVGRLNNSYLVFGRIEPAGIAPRAFGIVTARNDTDVDYSTDTGATFVDYGGPSVSVYIGSSRRCKVDLTAYLSAYASDAVAGFKVTGASTINPDYKKALWVGCSQASGVPIQPYVAATRVVYLSAADGLNSGTNVFTMMFRHGLEIPGGGGTITDREIGVQPF